MSSFHLISFQLCPFVQRAAIALKEKGIEYELTYIDLTNKPDWFLKISPMGKVPVLKVGEVALFESAPIAEYIDEVTEGSLHPEDAIARAQNRAWIEFTSGLCGAGHMLLIAPNEDVFRARVQETRAKLSTLEKVLGEGPFFNGEAFSLVDCAAAPALQRFAWVEQRVADAGIFEGFPKLSAWRDALLARESVQTSVIPEIQDLLDAYLAGGGTPTRKAPAAWVASQS